MKTHYLTGPVEGPEAFMAFARAESQLTEQEINYRSAWRINSQFQLYKNAMGARISTMIEQDQVITLEGWHECKDSILEVHIARHFGIPVLHFTATGMIKMKEDFKTGKIDYRNEYPCSMCSLPVDTSEISANDGICNECAVTPAFI